MSTDPAALAISARMDRLPGCRYLASLTARIAIGGWKNSHRELMPFGGMPTTPMSHRC
jgi:hypothetical protein